MKPLTLFLCLFIVVSAVGAEESTETLSNAAGRNSVAVTIYNEDLALVKEVRQVDLKAEINRVAFRDVAAAIQPETVSVRATQGGAIRLIEQNFEFDLLSPLKMLEKYVGREVTVINGKEKREKATVLSAQEGVVLKFGDRIEAGKPPRLAFDAVPPNLRDRPTLVSTLVAEGAGARTLELSYLTRGMSWQADYVAELGKEGKMDLNGWVTLTNQSGAAYGEDTVLQLVAGNVNRFVDPDRMFERSMRAGEAPKREEMAQESLFEYHLYTLERPTALRDNQTKQLALLSAAGVPTEKEYLLTGQNFYFYQRHPEPDTQLHPLTYLSFKNAGDGLGKPLPKGIVRVYMRDSRGGAQFIGEDAIDHTPKSERVRLKLGEAFDITAERKQTNHKQIAENVHESSFRIEIRNVKEEAVKVKVQEPVSGDWEVIKETSPHTKVSSALASWTVEVQPGKANVLEFTVRVHQ
jgi:hypothetical protein